MIIISEQTHILIYPFIDTPEQTPLTASIAVHPDGRITYHGQEWTPEMLARFVAAMEKAFELVEEKETK